MSVKKHVKNYVHISRQKTAHGKYSKQSQYTYMYTLFFTMNFGPKKFQNMTWLKGRNSILDHFHFLIIP